MAWLLPVQNKICLEECTGGRRPFAAWADSQENCAHTCRCASSLARSISARAPASAMRPWSITK
jgi:hypothetical protein